MSIQTQIEQDIKTAMLAKDQTRLRGLRAIKAAFLLANTEKGASEKLSEEAEIKVLQKLVKQRKESAAIYEAQNRTDLLQIETEEIAVIETYLPQQLDRESVKKHIQELIARHGASGIKDMGKIMGLANAAMAGRAEGRTVAEIVKELLS